MSNLISFICSLPQSSTGATAYEKELQRLYAETRGAAISNCMEGIATEAIDASKSGGLGGGATLGTLAQELLHLSADEFNLISTLGFPSYSAAYIYRLYLASSSNPLQIFIDAGVQINGIIKKNLLKNARVAFQAFAQLDVLQSEFDEWIRQKGGRAENELSEICQALRASCVRSIPEVYEDVKVCVKAVQTRGITLNQWDRHGAPKLHLHRSPPRVRLPT